MSISNEMFAEASTMMRKPVSEVYNAFIDPDITTHFWFSKGTGKLQPRAEVRWLWEPYNLDVPVKVIEMVENEKIRVTVGSGKQESEIEWTFSSLAEDQTRVHVVNRNFIGTDEEKIARLRDSSSGFALVLAGLKAYLEHGIHLNLVWDK